MTKHSIVQDAHRTGTVDVKQQNGTTTTPKQSHAIDIKHLAAKASAIAALLSALDFLPSGDYRCAMENCAGLADEVAMDLAALIGGAA